MRRDWHSAAVIWDFRDNEICFLVQDSESLDPQYKRFGKQTKSVGGGVKDEDANHLATAVREVKEEIWLRLRDGVAPPCIDFDEDPNTGHEKYFFLIYFGDLIGKMRDVDIDDGDSHLSNLRFIKSSEFYLVYETQRPALQKALVVLLESPSHELVGC